MSNLVEGCEREEEDLKKLMMLAAMLAMVLAAAVPVLAQDIESEVSATNEGDNSNQCVPVLSAFNTGYVDNEQTLEQEFSELDDFEVEGPSITVSPVLEAPPGEPLCEQTVSQAAAAG